MTSAQPRRPRVLLTLITALSLLAMLPGMALGQGTLEDAARNLQTRLDAARKLTASKQAELDALNARLTQESNAVIAQETAITKLKATSPAPAEPVLKAETDKLPPLKEAVAKTKQEMDTASAELSQRRQDEQKLIAEQQTVKDTKENVVALGNRAIYEQSFKALMILFVVAVLLENALAVIFNWNLFLAYVNVRGVKTPIMFILAWIIVCGFGLDILASLLAIYKAPEGAPPDFLGNPSTFGSRLITALILAGGSSGVNSLMKSLGYRKSTEGENAPTTPATGKGWAVVYLKRLNAVGDVLVEREEVLPPAAPAVPPVVNPIIGTITEKRPPFTRVLIRNKNRFPQNGGYPLDVNKTYKLVVKGTDAAGAPLSQAIGPFQVAEKAIVDFTVTL